MQNYPKDNDQFQDADEVFEAPPVLASAASGPQSVAETVPAGGHRRGWWLGLAGLAAFAVLAAIALLYYAQVTRQQYALWQKVNPDQNRIYYIPLTLRDGNPAKKALEWSGLATIIIWLIYQWIKSKQSQGGTMRLGDYLAWLAVGVASWIFAVAAGCIMIDFSLWKGWWGAVPGAIILGLALGLGGLQLVSELRKGATAVRFMRAKEVFTSEPGRALEDDLGVGMPGAPGALESDSLLPQRRNTRFIRGIVVLTALLSFGSNLGYYRRLYASPDILLGGQDILSVIAPFWAVITWSLGCLGFLCIVAKGRARRLNILTVLACLVAGTAWIMAHVPAPHWITRLGETAVGLALGAAFALVLYIERTWQAYRHGGWRKNWAEFWRVLRGDDFYRLHQWALAGSASAQFQLGQALLKGHITWPNVFEAQHWLAQAAHAGHLEAQYQLARLHCDLAGPCPNFVEAVKWLRIAAALGHPLAASNLSELESGIPPDDVARGRQHAEKFLNARNAADR